MSKSDETYMQLALEMAIRGQGFVEPNPMVGCVLVRNGKIIGQGWHREFGGPHAEVNAIRSVSAEGSSGSSSAEGVAGATAYVTLEPCSHVGKTGRCTSALIEADISRVVVACADPNPLVSGKGIEQLRKAGIDVTTDVLAEESKSILAPYLKRTQQNTPWIIAKWAMTLDGKIATASGDSKWISNEGSRAIVHQIRGRIDGVMVGIGTVIADNPMLNARPAGQRTGTRIVVDSSARIPIECKLVKTANQFPTLIAVGPAAQPNKCEQLKASGCSVFQSQSDDANDRLNELLTHLAAEGMTNVLVEGGGQLLGSLNDIGQIDEIHTFIGPKILGGNRSVSPVGGAGQDLMNNAGSLQIENVKQIGNDVYIVARVIR